MSLQAIGVAGMAMPATCPALAQDSQPSLLSGGDNALSETHGA